MRCGVEGKIPIFLGVPVEARDFSWGHDRGYDTQSYAARMRNRGTRRKKIKQPTTKALVGPADCR